jgi:hypothetical protein
VTSPVNAPVAVNFTATGVPSVQRSLKLVGGESDQMSRRVGGSMRQIAAGAEAVARQGKLTGEALKQIVSQGAEMAFMFGAAGPIVGAVAILGVAIFEHITRRMQEARDEINKARTEFEGISDLMAAGKAAQLRFSGSPTAIRKEGESNADFIARRFGIGGVRGRIEELRGQLPKDVVDFIGKGRGSGVGMMSGWGLGKAVDEGAKELDALIEQLVRLKRESAELAPILAKLAEDEGKRAKNADAAALARELLAQALPTASIERDNRWNKLLAPIGARGMPGVQAATAGGTLMTTPIGPHQQFGLKAPDVAHQFDNLFVNPLGEAITKSIGEGIGGAISAGFDAAFARGANIASVAGAFGGVALRTIGGVFKDIGMQSLLGMQLMADVKLAIAAWNPALGIAASIGLIALGAALQSAGGRMGSAGGSFGGGGGGGSSSSVSPPTIIDRGFINPATATIGSAASMSAREPITLQPIIIGPNDPVAQRAILELVRNAQRRGGV